MFFKEEALTNQVTIIIQNESQNARIHGLQLYLDTWEAINKIYDWES